MQEESLNTVIIIPITETYTENYRQAVGEVAREGNFLTMLDAFPKDTTEAFVKENIAASNPHLIALHDGRVVGWCDITPKSERPVHSHCGTMGMGLLKPYRGKGLGKKLLTQALEAAKKKGWSRIELTVRATNHPARALYEKMGFVLEGTLRKEWHTAGMFYDTHIMAKLFDTP